MRNKFPIRKCPEGYKFKVALLEYLIERRLVKLARIGICIYRFPLNLSVHKKNGPMRIAFFSFFCFFFLIYLKHSASKIFELSAEILYEFQWPWLIIEP